MTYATDWYPIPPGRGRWRFSLHARQFADADPQSTLITEIVGARGIRLETAWCSPAKLTLTLDGHHPTTAMIVELTQDIYAWRWDETTGVDRCMFRGIVAQSLDEVTEQSHTVNFVCHDYLEMLTRRITTNSYECTQRDQDNVVTDLIDRAKVVRASSGTAFTPGSYLPLRVELVREDGTPRGNSGQLRDRVYPAQSNIGQMIEDLAACIGGFDYDVIPGPAWPGGSLCDVLRLFHPSQGVHRDTPLMYGTTVSGFTRSTNAQNYANYWRTLGHDAGAAEGEDQLFAESWNNDVNDVDRIPVGTWMDSDNAADVSIQDTLQQKADGHIVTNGLLIPSWTMQLRPGRWFHGVASIGDVVPIIVNSGRLQEVQDTIRILGLNYTVGSDGDEGVEVVVGRPTPTLYDVLTRADRDVDALTRRSSDIGPSGPDAPVGSMFFWPGTTPPTTWAWADGRVMSRAQYPELFDIIGYTWGGTGDSFNLPDCRSRMVVGAGQGSGLTDRVRGSFAGFETVVLTTQQLATHAHVGGDHTHTGPSHQHGIPEHTHTYPRQPGAVAAGTGSLQAGTNQEIDAQTGASGGFVTAGGTGPTGSAGAVATTNAGQGEAHPNMPPWIAIGTMIRILPPLRPQRKVAA